MILPAEDVTLYGRKARVVDLDGQDSANGTGVDRQVSNVVQFPRDWIGPSEELVPFGPRADRIAVEDPPDLPSASDFWGEHAAAMHSVLEDPNAERAPTESPLAGADPQPTKRRLTSSRRIAAPATVALVAASVVAMFAFGQSGHVQRPPVVRTSTGFLADAGRRLTGSEGIVGAVRHEQVSAVAAMRRMRVMRHVLTPRHHAAARPHAAAGGGATATTVTVHYSSPSLSTAPVATNVGPSTSSGSGSAGTTAGGTSGSASSATSTGSGSGGSTSAPTGPVGPGAPFGPGHLG